MLPRHQIYVEVERARLTRTLAGIREAEGKIAEAAEVLQEVAVETFGSMDKREKAEFLLEQVRTEGGGRCGGWRGGGACTFELASWQPAPTRAPPQVRLTSAHGDWVRTAILANKVNKKVLDEPGFEDIRTRFYALLIQLHEQRCAPRPAPPPAGAPRARSLRPQARLPRDPQGLRSGG